MARYQEKCPECGKALQRYSKNKYCTHACYVKHRSRMTASSNKHPLTKWRLLKGLTAQMLAERLNVSKAFICKIEHNRPISLEGAVMVSRETGIDSKLFKLSESPAVYFRKSR
ncbi:MAG: helix-turn-helix transcriptional regulator [Bacteroidales bacterium]|jgi:hypothetical protein